VISSRKWVTASRWAGVIPSRAVFTFDAGSSKRVPTSVRPVDVHLRQYAGVLNLDTERFNREMAQHRSAGRIEDDVLGGARNGVRGTPALFINGVRLEGGADRESLLRVICGAASS
jgi:hypothetical protein